jgi:hypothetical protein
MLDIAFYSDFLCVTDRRYYGIGRVGIAEAIGRAY